MLDFTSLNWLAIIVATVAHMALGAAWFGVFAKPWARLSHPGKTEKEIGEGPKWIYGIAAGGGLVTAIILYATLQAVGAMTLGAAVVVTLLLWAGFVAVKYATTYAFAWKPWLLLAIDAGYPLASMLVMAVIFAVWP